MNDACFDSLNTGIADQLQQTARIIKKRDGLQAHRDAFYTDIGGFDTHSDNGPALTALLTQIDNAIGCFKNEMVSQGIWGNVTVRFLIQWNIFATIVKISNLLCHIFLIVRSTDCFRIRIRPNINLQWCWNRSCLGG